MYLFLRNWLFFLLFFCFIVIVTFYFPVKPSLKNSFLFSQIQKDSLLKTSKKNRLILIGGSSCSFGNYSQIFKDSLNLNPINTGINAGIGLKYMLNHNEEFIRKGDIVIVIPEYDQYFGNQFYGSVVIFPLIFDISKDFKSLSFKHYIKVAPYFFNYFGTKFNIKDYLNDYVLNKDSNQSYGIYGRYSFNFYGDAVKHYGLEREFYAEQDKNLDPFNEEVIDELKIFEAKLKEKGATLYISFPGFTEESYDNNKENIDLIYSKLKYNDMHTIGEPIDFKLKKSFAFNSPYHLTKEGAILHSSILANQLKYLLDGKK